MSRIICAVLLLIGMAATSGIAESRKLDRDQKAVNARSNAQSVFLVRVNELRTEESESSKIIYNLADRIQGDAAVVLEHTRPEEREKKGTNVMLRVMQLSF